MSTAADLGPITEARIAATFAETLTITAQACAKLLGFDVKSLREMDAAGLIGGVIVGASTRRYTEADVRAYLAGAPAIARAGQPGKKPCRSTRTRKRAVTGNTTSSTAAEGFTARRAKLTVAARNGSRTI